MELTENKFLKSTLPEPATRVQKNNHVEDWLSTKQSKQLQRTAKSPKRDFKKTQNNYQEMQNQKTDTKVQLSPVWCLWL